MTLYPSVTIKLSDLASYLERNNITDMVQNKQDATTSGSSDVPPYVPVSSNHRRKLTVAPETNST